MYLSRTGTQKGSSIGENVFVRFQLLTVFELVDSLVVGLERGQGTQPSCFGVVRANYSLIRLNSRRKP